MNILFLILETIKSFFQMISDNPVSSSVVVALISGLIYHSLSYRFFLHKQKKVCKKFQDLVKEELNNIAFSLSEICVNLRTPEDTPESYKSMINIIRQKKIILCDDFYKIVKKNGNTEQNKHFDLCQLKQVKEFIDEGLNTKFYFDSTVNIARLEKIHYWYTANNSDKIDLLPTEEGSRLNKIIVDINQANSLIEQSKCINSTTMIQQKTVTKCLSIMENICDFI